MSILKFNLRSELIDYLNEQNIKHFFPVQEQTIPLIQKKQQLFVNAPTGSGKTLAFLLPIFNQLDASKEGIEGIKAIIIVPTRELGLQINAQIKALNKHFENKLSTQLMIGGNDRFEDIDNYGNKNILVTTSSRLQKIHNQKPVSLKNLDYLIIDEIDMIADFGFLEELITFYNQNIKTTSLSVFSATLNSELENQIKKFFNDKSFKQIKIINDTPKTNYQIKVNERDKFQLLLKLLADDEVNPFLAIIFAKTNEEVKAIYLALKEAKIQGVDYFNNDLTARQRKRLLKDLKANKIIYLVTTDLMARGMDFPGTSHIINFSLPVDINYYLHRIGRTNRSNIVDGKVFTFVEQKDIPYINKIKDKYKIEFINKRL